MSFEKESKDFENLLEKDFKKKHGIFYTDLSLVKNMVDFLNISQNATILDPNCGVGNFLHVLKNLGYKNIYGCDLDKNTIKKAIELVNIKTIYQLDTILPTGNQILLNMNHEKFDYIVGNPPYATLSKEITIENVDFAKKVKESGSNLFVAALYKSFELVKDNGIISVIIPKNLLHVSLYKSLRQYILENKTILSIVDLGNQFKNVRGEQIILTLKNKKIENNKIKFYNYKNQIINFMVEIEQSYFSDKIIIFENNMELLIYNKLKNNYKTLQTICIEKIKRGNSNSGELKGKEIKKFGYKTIQLPQNGNSIFIQNIFSGEAGIIATYGGNLSPQETITVVKLKDKKMCKYILGLLHSMLCNFYLIKFIFNNSKLTIHTDAKYLNQIPIVVDYELYEDTICLVEQLENTDYLSKEWFDIYEKLNQLVYKIYQLEDSEVNYIEENMKTILSSKWFLDK